VRRKVYLSLGSNLGDREANLRQAITGLEKLGSVTAVSSFYETEPVEVESEQPWFLNAAVCLETDLEADELLAAILALEQAMGRKREGVRSPRIIDIDILLFGDLNIHQPQLIVPHPGLERRRFVLEPLAQIAPDAVHPITKRIVKEMLNALPAAAGATRRWKAGK
jgi:2-amino-4-hydroxy-6-hydroxymethyldihydropteridine diphosphokinase